MKNKTGSTLTISAVAFIAALLVDIYMMLVYPSSVEVIIAVSLIVIVDTYFMVDAILAKIDEVVSLNLDKQNELTKVQKGIYSVAKREEIARSKDMSGVVDLMIEMKNENASLMNSLIEQDKVMTKLSVKKDIDNTTKVVNSNERIAVLIAQMATANAKSSAEALEILNDICKELESRNGKLDNTNDYSHLRVMKSKAE
ncbi:MAG: hypothetical protein PUB54_00685 [Lachnospiraceae bacterium]|nr:hypothetical protein [Lachnospiraceae bacterium]